MNPKRAHEEWRPCAPGELLRYRQIAAVSRRVRRLTPWLAMGVMIALLAVTAWVYWVMPWGRGSKPLGSGRSAAVPAER